MDRIPVSSSDLASVGYDNETMILEVEFVNGAIYEYSNVPQVIHDGLMTATSHGSYFAREIKNSYPYQKIG